MKVNQPKTIAERLAETRQYLIDIYADAICAAQYKDQESFIEDFADEVDELVKLARLPEEAPND